MQVLGVVSGLAGLALMLFAGSRTRPRAKLPWQIAACLVYLAVGVGALVGSASLPPWTVWFLTGGGVGALVSALSAGRRTARADR